jgi:type IV pilus assembly protein PilQ
MKMGKFVQYAGTVSMGCIALAMSLMVHAAEVGQTPNKIEKVDVATLPGGKLNVKVVLSQPMQNPPAGFSLTNPSRIALDFPNTTSGLEKNTLAVDQGMLRSVGVAQAKGRTRMVLNLNKPSAYTTSISGNIVSIDLQPSESVAASASLPIVTHFAEEKPGEQQHAIGNVDFMRGKNGEGRVVVDLSDSATGINIQQQGQKIVVDFIDTNLPENLQRRLNVTDFATPVLNVDTVRNGKNVRMTIEPKGAWEHSAYQADKKFIVDVRPLLEDPNKLTQGSRPGYKGEKLSLNFQDIDVRSVLQVIADFTGFNIITSDSVGGRLTLRLKDVPWDQALDIIMQARGLGMRKEGNVVWIAPNEELAARTKSRLEAEQGIADLEPMVTQSFAVKYQKAEDVKKLITDPKQPLLSKRGSAVVDGRTNTLFVEDISKNLAKVEKIINQIDIPVRQVLIEGRIVLASDGYSKELGARFGVAAVGSSGDTKIGINGNATNSQLNAFGKTTGLDPNPFPVAAGGFGANGLNSNLPAVAANAGKIGMTLLNLPAGILLNLELSAAEADNKTKTVSSPRVITANRQKAMIESGVEIPYQEASSSGATSVSFKNATLGLEVTPQITPDNKISMDLDVHKDNVGEVFNGVPSINTNSVQTQVLVNNGETAVLGGIFETTTGKKVDKVPFFGDIPVFGNLFKRTATNNTKQELLIFITPKLLEDSLKVE